MDFPAEVTDIPGEQHDEAAKIAVGTALRIDLVDEDPAFLNGGTTIGWLAVNIEEVTECLQAGWRYRGEVRSNEPSPAGPIIITQVTCQPPAK